MNNTIGIAEIKLSESEIDVALNVLRSGALRQGKECDAFEREFAAKVGAKFAVTNASGSAALHLAFMSFLEKGDEVLVPSFTFIATGSMVVMAGGKPIFCDIDPETFLIDLEDAERRITPRTRAVAPVHLFGNVCDIDAITAFAKKHGLIIVWDAAQAHGGSFKGQDVGAFGSIVCYSFYPSKNMFVGEGGMTCTDNPEYEYKIRFMRTHGQTGKYYHTMLGLNYRMTDVEAAIGREQLKRLDSMLAIRRRNALLLNQGVAVLKGIHPQQVTPNSDHAWHQYCVIIDPETFGCNRDILSERLKEQGVSTGVHYPRGLHQQPIFEQLYGKTSLPNTEYISERILALPVHHGLTREHVDRIVKAVQAAHR
ncbi:MAG: DegT/DnrJ/EryC1/StrS family aminotransferase [Thermodesulfobacteriota bacterium]